MCIKSSPFGGGPGWGILPIFAKKSDVRKFLLSAAILLTVVCIRGQIPPGYYDPAAGKTGTALQAALHNIIKGHTVASYSSLPTHFASTDARPNNVVWDMYSDVPGGTPPYLYHYFAGDECGNYNSEGDCYNREHSWPASWFNDASPMYSDLFHIYPTDGYVNNRRSNYAYGTVGSASWTSQNGSRVGTCNWPGFSGTAFEPLNAYKGDFARSYFYMSTRYYTEDSGWNTTDMTNKSQLKPWALQMMLHWAGIDPVSQKETDRNNAVYVIQHNRNPFIDHPEYIAAIWGNPVGTGPENPALHSLTLYPNPAADFVNIDLDETQAAGGFPITLISVTGSVIAPEWRREGATLTLDLRTLPKGVWMVLVVTEKESFRAKLIRE